MRSGLPVVFNEPCSGLHHARGVVVPGELFLLDGAPGLGAEPGRRTCVVAHNGYAGELEEILEQHQVDPGEYQQIALTNSRVGPNVFPLAEYAKGIDFLVGSAGYNLFYESRF